MKFTHSLVGRKEKELALVQIFYLFILPPALIYADVIPEAWRFITLIFACVIIFGIIKYEGWSSEMLGLVSVNKKSLIFYILFTLFGAIFFYFISTDFFNKNWQGGERLFIYFLPVSILQEFAFRGVLFPLSFQLLDSRLAVVVLNVLLFTFIHIIYPPLSLSIPIAVLSGTALTLAYMKYPNLILISISHAALNLLAVGYGFFSVK